MKFIQKIVTQGQSAIPAKRKNTVQVEAIPMSALVTPLPCEKTVIALL